MKNLRMLFCMLMGLLIGSVLGIVIANLTHNQQKKKHAQMAATEVIGYLYCTDERGKSGNRGFG